MLLLRRRGMDRHAAAESTRAYGRHTTVLIDQYGPRSGVPVSMKCPRTRHSAGSHPRRRSKEVEQMRLQPSRSCWVRINCPRPAARVRLFCLPFAGGSANSYWEWPTYLPEDVEVVPI